VNSSPFLTQGWCEPPFSRAVRMGRRAFFRLMRLIWVISPASFLDVAPVLSEEACEYPEYFTSKYISPAYHLGEYQIRLSAPDYHDLDAVQRHLAFSVVLSDLLKSELHDQSGGACNAIISASRFPDLRVILYLSQSSQPNETSRLHCSSALQNILQHPRPAEASVSKAASSEAQLKSLVALSPSSASEILPIVLRHIYDAGSIMRAIVSVDDKTFRSVEPSQFLEWLRAQGSAAGSVGLTPIRTDCEPKPSGLVPDGGAPAQGIPRDAVMRAGTIQVTLGVDRLPPLRHMVVAGYDRAIPNAPITSLATEKFCNREHEFVLESGSTPTAVRIRCWTQDVYETDGWTVFYCELKDCVSESAAKAVAAAIASDPDVVAFAQGNSGADHARGPYIVNIE
jgi:hypothetical protein